MDLVKSMQEYDLVKQPQKDATPDEYLVEVEKPSSDDNPSP